MSGHLVEIYYRHAGTGVLTQRRVSVTLVERGAKGAIYLRGFCHLRREPRGFRLAGIEALTDRQSGEVLDTPAAIAAWAEGQRAEARRSA